MNCLKMVLIWVIQFQDELYIDLEMFVEHKYHHIQDHVNNYIHECLSMVISGCVVSIILSGL